MSRTLLIVVLLALMAASLQAQTVARPTVTVVPFEIGRGSAEFADQGADIADGLAKLLADSGRFRVLDRAWLPAPKVRQSTPSIPTLRQAATSAGVRYLVLGSALQIIGRTAPFTTAGFLNSPVRFPSSAGTQMAGSWRIEIQIIDAESGELIRRMSARSAGTTQAALTDLAAGLSRLSPQLVADIQ